MAATEFVVELPGDATIAAVKQRLQHMNTDHKAHKIRLFVALERDSNVSATAAHDEAVAHEVLVDERTIDSYKLAVDATVNMVVLDRVPGEYLRMLGQGVVQGVQSICASSGGDELFLCTFTGVHVMNATDGALVRSLGGADGDVSLKHGATCLCVSPLSPDQVFVGASRRIHTYCTADGAFVRSFGALGQHALSVCVSAASRELFVIVAGMHQVRVFDALSGEPVRTIGSHGSGNGELNDPRDMCLSHDGALLFVADNLNNRVQVFRAADGAYQYAHRDFYYPSGVCLSPDGAQLYVADSANRRVQVLNVADGVLIGSIVTADDAPHKLVWPLRLYASSASEVFVAEGNTGAGNDGSHGIKVFSAF